MFKIGERVVYGQNGVMTILDIREEAIMGEARKYYVLHAEDAGEDSLTFVPCDNERLVSDMRYLMTKEEVTKLLTEAKAEKKLAWVEDSRQRNTAFKKTVDSGDYKELLRMIFAIEEKMSERQDSGKRSYLSDEVIMKKAKRLVYSEISAVMGLSDTETERYVKEC